MGKSVIINNEATQTEAATIAQLAVELALPERGVALAVNNKIIPRTNWAEATFEENDKITIIKAAFGG